MFKIIFCSLFILVTLTASENIFDKGVDFKEGVIHYSINGGEIGTKTVYIKEYGKRRVIYTNIKNNFMRKNRTSDAITHITPHWIYEINLETNTTTKLPNLKNLLYKQFLKLSFKEKSLLIKNLKNLKKRSVINLKEDIEFKETKILDYLCSIEFIDGVKTYTAQNSDLILKTETEILGFNSNTIATKIEKKPLDSRLFVLPKNLSIKNSPALKRAKYQKANEIIKYLLSPNLTPIHLTQNKTKTTQKEDLQKIIQEGIKTLDAL